MAKKLFSLFAVFALTCASLFAGGKTSDNQKLPIITEVSPMSVTLDAGNEATATYGITSATKITLNALPVTIDEIRAGMAAKITTSPDGRNVAALDARGAPRETAKPKKPTDNVWVNIK